MLYYIDISIDTNIDTNIDIDIDIDIGIIRRFRCLQIFFKPVEYENKEAQLENNTYQTTRATIV